MITRSIHAVLAVLVFAGSLGAESARALDRGDRCTLKSPLQVTVKTRAGSVEAVLETGTDVEVTFAGEGGLSRVQAGETNGTVTTVDLEAACAGTLKLCRLRKQVTMYQQNTSESRSWLVKAGADMSVLKQGKTWAAVRVGDLQGFVPSNEMSGACESIGSSVTVPDGASESPDGPVEEIDRGEGPGVLVVPFSLEGNAPAGAADGYWQTLWERAAFFRPDAGRVEDDGARKLGWKAFVDHGIQRGKNADTRYVLLGRLFIADAPKEAAKADSAPAEGYVLQLAIVDTQSKKVLKGIRIKPSMRVEDPWADLALSHLLPMISAAPGSKVPDAQTSGAKTMELAPNVREEPTQSAGAIRERESAPWFANPFGYVALGVAVVAGSAGGVLAALSLSDNAAANDTPVTDSARQDLRSSALVKGASADGLGVVAVAAVVTGVVVFVTRAGLED